MKKFALIVAGGKGLRMGMQIPKQFLELAGKPVLMRSIEAFMRFDPTMEIVLVLPQNHFELWSQLCQKYGFRVEVKLAVGGENRIESVRNGLSKIDDDGIVFIHDAVRPLVSQQTIQNCFENAVQSGSAIPVIPLTDSIRQITDEGNTSVNRDNFRLVQTPQTFEIKQIKKAFQQAVGSQFTDDASIFEAAGQKVTLVEGNVENIKITHESDLEQANILFPKMAK